MNAYKLYRIARWLYLHHVPLFPQFIKGIIYLIHNSSIPYEAEIGKHCRFLYGGIGCVIGKKTKIGNYVIIGTNVLTGGRSNKEGQPVIGNNVYIATGAKILGDITIADNVIIGANAVVINDIPGNCSVGGVPARILKENIDVTEFCSLSRYGNIDGGGVVIMIYFGIPLMSRKAAKDWGMVSALFNRTLWSCYNQTDPDFRIIVACHEIPRLEKVYDDRVEFIRVSEEKAPIPKNQQEKMLDKGYKTHTVAMRLREWGGGYAMMVDADDLISCRIAGFVNRHPHENGFYVKTGYVYFVGDNYMKVMPNFSSGSACMVNYVAADLPDAYPDIMTDNCDANQWLIRKRHGGVVAACKAAGRPLKPLPFKGAVYVLGSGENHSLYGKTTKYQTRLRELREIFEKKYKICGDLQREFSVDWI